MPTGVALRVEFRQLACVHCDTLLVIQNEVDLLERTRHDGYEVVADCSKDGLCSVVLRESTPRTEHVNMIESPATDVRRKCAYFVKFYDDL